MVAWKASAKIVPKDQLENANIINGSCENDNTCDDIIAPQKSFTMSGGKLGSASRAHCCSAPWQRWTQVLTAAGTESSHAAMFFWKYANVFFCVLKRKSSFLNYLDKCAFNILHGRSEEVRADSTYSIYVENLSDRTSAVPRKQTV